MRRRLPVSSSGAGGDGYFSPAPPRILAHRGFAIDAPENTMLAFAKALALGVTHLETDVHASLDGVAVISHDPDLSRLTGCTRRVNELTLAKLKRIGLGEGQTFASLAEALDGFPEARFNIDIKSADAVAPTVDAIRAADATGRVLVTSFSERRRRAAVRRLAGVATSASALSFACALLAAKLRLSAVVRGLLSNVDAVQVPERAAGLRVITPRTVRALHSANLEIHVWTINDVETMNRLLDLGVDGLVTDRPDLAIEVLRSRR
ncbi:MAG: glycerophosphodiester phosphodiesterase [Lacisediminihabitans sp.]